MGPDGAGSSVLLVRNVGRHRLFQHHLGRQQVPHAGTGILQGNRENIQRMCRVQVFTCPTFLSLQHEGFCIKHLLWLGRSVVQCCEDVLSRVQLCSESC